MALKTNSTYGLQSKIMTKNWIWLPDYWELSGNCCLLNTLVCCMYQFLQLHMYNTTSCLDALIYHFRETIYNQKAIK